MFPPHSLPDGPFQSLERKHVLLFVAHRLIILTIIDGGNDKGGNMGLLSDDRTPKERCIIETARTYPNWSKKQIATHCDTSSGYVTQTLRRYGDPWDLSL